MNSYNPYRAYFSATLGPAHRHDEDIAFLRMSTWEDFGVLIVSPSDPYLTKADRETLLEIAQRIYWEED